MRRTIMLTMIPVLIFGAAAVNASTGWESDFDILWDITVANNCSGVEVTYNDCRLVEEGLFWIAFIPNQNRVSAPHGKQIRVNTVNGCMSVIMEEVE